MLKNQHLEWVISVFITLLVLIVPLTNTLYAQREYLFTAKTGYTVLSGPWDIKSADLDDDGHMDLVTADRYSGTVTVALNSGTGNFDDAWSYPVGYRPWELDLADLDDDGDNDIAVTLTDLEVSGPPEDDYDLVAVLFNDGSGGFSGLRQYPIGNEPRTVFLADFGEDGNGDVDIITANEQATSSVSVLFNDGYGNFSDAINYSLGIEPRALFVADLNGDGFNDTVTANKMDDNVTVLLNDGSGNFGNITSIRVGWGPWDVFLENIVGDSSKDIIVLNRYSGFVEIQENDGSGNFSFRAQYNIENNNSVYLLVGDADLDGYLDILCSDINDDLLTIFFHNTTSSSYQKMQRTVEGGPRSFVLADLGIGRPGTLNIATANVGGNSVTILVSDVPPTIEMVTPYYATETEVRIEWNDYDPDSNASIELYYYPVGQPDESVLLATINEDEGDDFYVWNVSSVEEGDYQFRVTIYDDFSAESHSFGAITVQREPPSSDDVYTGPSPGLIIVAIIGTILMIIVFYFIFRKKPEPTEEAPKGEPVQQSSDGFSGGT